MYVEKAYSTVDSDSSVGTVFHLLPSFHHHSTQHNHTTQTVTDGLPADRQVGHDTDAASKHSLCYFSIVIVIIANCDMPRQELSLCERVCIHNTCM